MSSTNTQTSLDCLNIIRSLKEELLNVEFALTKDEGLLLLKEQFAADYYGFQDEYGLDAIFHCRHQCALFQLPESKGGVTHIMVRNHYRTNNEIFGNSVLLARKRESETQDNRGRWEGKWDFIHKFENVSIEHFKKICDILSVRDVRKLSNHTPYYEPIAPWLEANAIKNE